MRIVHYLNQFFGGLGGEEKAGTPLETRDGAIGPGKLLEQLRALDAEKMGTLKPYLTDAEIKGLLARRAVHLVRHCRTGGHSPVHAPPSSPTCA